MKLYNNRLIFANEADIPVKTFHFSPGKPFLNDFGNKIPELLLCLNTGIWSKSAAPQQLSVFH